MRSHGGEGVRGNLDNADQNWFLLLLIARWPQRGEVGPALLSFPADMNFFYVFFL